MSEDRMDELWPSITFACKNCGKKYTPPRYTSNSLFCSKACRKQYDLVHKEANSRAQVAPRTFVCRSCGATVTTDGPLDRRKSFCSVRCEKWWWKHGYIREAHRVQRAEEQDPFERGICPMCNEQFVPNSPRQIYCCKRCAQRYYKAFGHGHGYPIRMYRCNNPKCDKMVVTEGGKDRRYRFCSKHCCDQFWWSAPKDSPYRNQKWHSVREYASWERRTNGI